MPIQSDVTYEVKNALQYQGIPVVVKTDGTLIYWNFDYDGHSYAESFNANEYSAGEVSEFAKKYINTMLGDK